MRRRIVESRLAARIAVAGLTLGLVALAGIALLSSNNTHRAADGLRVLNLSANSWGLVFQQINVEDNAVRAFSTARTAVGRQPLASAVGGAGPVLDRLIERGTAVDVDQAMQVKEAYVAYSSLLTEMIALGLRGDAAAVQLLVGQAEAGAAGMRLHVVANIERTRLATNADLDDVDAANKRFRTAALGATGVDVALLILCAMVVLGYQRQIERQALHDALTGLPNRVLLHARTTQAVQNADRTGGRVGLLLIDLNGFKEINDTLGHHRGDWMLQQVAAQFRRAVRSTDTVARLGGDEFAILAPRLASDDELAALAGRVLDEMGRPVEFDGTSLEVSASIGTAVYPDDSQDVSQLLQHADLAMYAAKRARSGATQFRESMNEHRTARLSLLTEIRRALSADEIVLHYQPKVETGTGVVQGVEALARWQHPRRGLLGPVEFVPVIEENGLMGPFTDVVLATALRQCRRWLDRDLTVAVAVNVGASCLADHEFPTRVLGLLRQHGVDPALLTIEITETAVVGDTVDVLAVLARLRHLGVRLAVDDFGTGYSSLAYLKDLPIHELKIDRSFISTLLANDGTVAIVRAVVDVAHSLGLSVVAEGVEDERSWAEICRLGCDIGQGYLLSRPMPADDVAGWILARREVHPAAA